MSDGKLAIVVFIIISGLYCFIMEVTNQYAPWSVPLGFTAGAVLINLLNLIHNEEES